MDTSQSKGLKNMTVEIQIGERYWEDDPDNDEGGYWLIKDATDPNAPDIPGQIYGKGENEVSFNIFHYGDFLRWLGNLDKEALTLLEDQDIRPLKNELAQALNRARKRFEAVNPHIKPAYNQGDKAANFARLIQLEHWAVLALETMPEPYIKIY